MISYLQRFQESKIEQFTLQENHFVRIEFQLDNGKKFISWKNLFKISKNQPHLRPSDVEFLEKEYHKLLKIEAGE